MQFESIHPVPRWHVAKRILETATSDPSMQDAAMAASRSASSGVVGSAVQRWVHVVATLAWRFAAR
jgi:hypothetical protein